MIRVYKSARGGVVVFLLRRREMSVRKTAESKIVRNKKKAGELKIGKKLEKRMLKVTPTSIILMK